MLFVDTNEAQCLIDSLISHDKDFNEMIDDLTSFYDLDKESLLERFVYNLSNYDLSRNEIEFNELRSIARISALSLLLPTIVKPITFIDDFEVEGTEIDDQADLLKVDFSYAKQVA
jgi:hypothetical protein